jgi:intracellular sulfur oxidation DsrE/DsrF family protein
MMRTATTLGVCALLALAPFSKALPAEPLSEEKPFAEAYIILQVSDAAPVHHQATLDIANNLMKHYGGQDMADIEVIAFGAGVPILYADNAETADRISSLIEHGVRFYACGNTLDTIERKQGQRPELQPGVQTVQTGVAFMVDEIRRGYVPIHP